eukprot:311682-Lingulodinium_polyedra.AAC.1
MEVLAAGQAQPAEHGRGAAGPRTSPTLDSFKSAAAARAKLKPRSKPASIAPPKVLPAASASV